MVLWEEQLYMVLIQSGDKSLWLAAQGRYYNMIIGLAVAH